MKLKKSLGQNFLKSQGAIKKIISVSFLTQDDTVLEIGPGDGALTKNLLETGAKVIVVEKDDRLIPILEEKFQKELREKKLQIIHDDILKTNLNILPKKYKLVANIPYYITGQIIRMFLELEHQPELITILIQKEVAERIIAKDKKESLLSISIKAYGEPKYISTVPKGSFNPMPKVDSAIISIYNISKNNFKIINEKDFFEILHFGFAHKRKQLIPNLSEVFKKDNLLYIFDKLKINQKARAEEISLEKWLEITTFKNT